MFRQAAAVRRYFGEEGVDRCGQCDLCLGTVATVDATEAAQKALSAAHRMGGRFGRGRLVEHLLGKTKDPSAFEAGLSTFGVGQEFSATGWRDLIDQLLEPSGALHQPGVNADVLTGQTFFPELITGPFHSGLTVVFGAAAVMMLIGAAASMFNPGRYGTEAGADNAA